MSSFRSMKHQIFAAAALLLSGPYITAAAASADQAQWSKSIPIDEERNPGERIEAYIVDGLLHARRLDQNDSPLWHLILAEADPNQPPTLEHLGAGSAVEVRHANGAYFVRDTWGFPSTLLAAHRQQLAPETFASLDITVPQNGIDMTGFSYSSRLTPAMFQQLPPEAFASYDSTALANLVQEFGPQKPSAGALADGAFLHWDDAQLLDSGGVLTARYITPAEADRKQQEHKLVRGAIPFNIEAQRWLNPIEHGDHLGWFKGKVVLLHFWATWSPESIEQLAHYDELYKKHKDQGLVVIAIHNSQGADDLDAFVAERGYTLPIAVDAGVSAQRYGIWSWPQSVLLDRDCRLAWLSQEGETPTPAQLKYLLNDTDAFPTR